MDETFWHQRWSDNCIAFHLDHANPRLLRHWPELYLPAPSRVLVPLCGKSVDMAWLRDACHDVVGVEISPLAVAAFFEEQRLPARRELIGGLVRWSAPGITIWCGDLFELDAELLGPVDAVYDRAALIAFPDDMRHRYARHLAGLLPTGAVGLLITMDYAQSRMPGPPFSVPPAEVHALLDAFWQVTPIGQHESLADFPRFAEAGLTELHERIWRLERLPPR